MFKSYSEFINENLNNIFKSAHGAIDPEDLIPLKDLIGNPKLPSEEEFQDVVNYLEVDKDDFFYNRGDMLHPICYWNGPIYYGFFGGLNMEAIKMMRVKEYLIQMNRIFTEALKKKDYERLFSRIDKKILIPTFIKMYKSIPDNKKYDVFIDLYVRSEYGFSSFPKDIIIDCFKLRTKSTEWKKRMTKLKSVLKSKDKTITVYRGMNRESAKQEYAFSWTLDEATAQFFADRFEKGKGKIITRDVDLSEIIDYLEDRGEAEIIILPYKFKH
jgi:hypothetical protein